MRNRTSTFRTVQTIPSTTAMKVVELIMHGESAYEIARAFDLDYGFVVEIERTVGGHMSPTITQ